MEVKSRGKIIPFNGMTFNRKSKVVTDADIYDIDLLPSDMENLESNYFNKNTAYLLDDFFYLYRGEHNPDNIEELKPGIYRDKTKSPVDKNLYFIVEPTTDEEKEEYNSIGKISSRHYLSIVDEMNKKGNDVVITVPDVVKIFQPEITENDDILKIIAKKALQAKNVDLDRYKDRFSNKNELFNFKQVLRSGNKLSMKIFMRGMEALNLTFTITVMEKSDNNVVGDPLKEKIVVGSEDTYAMSA